MRDAQSAARRPAKARCRLENGSVYPSRGAANFVNSLIEYQSQRIDDSLSRDVLHARHVTRTPLRTSLVIAGVARDTRRHRLVMRAGRAGNQRAGARKNADDSSSQARS